MKNIKGSGPHGRIVKADVQAEKVVTSVAAISLPMISSATSDSVKLIYQDREYSEIALDGMRKVIASRLTEAKQTIPHFYLRRSVQLDNLLKIRSEMNTGLTNSGIKISVNDFIVKASARALQDVQKLTLFGHRIVYYN